MGYNAVMSEEFQDQNELWLSVAAKSEIEYIRSLGSSRNLILASANLGAYEALLHILSFGDRGAPVYQAVTNVQSRYSSQSGVLSRLRMMRQLGLIEDRPGVKKSQVCLVPSETLLNELVPILLKRHGGGR
jgi:hypothetical protein